MKKNTEQLSGEKQASRRVFKNGAFSIVATAILAVIVIAANLLANLLPETYTKLEAANKSVYSLSDDTKSYLQSLQSDVTVYYIVQSGSEESQFEMFLARAAAVNSRITVKKIDPVIQPDFVSNYTSGTLSDNSIIVVSGDRHKAIDSSNIYVYNYGIQEDTSAYYVKSIDFKGEDQLVTGIKYVMAESLPVVYITEGHGEVTIPDSYLSALTAENIEYKYLTLLTAGKVPADADCLIIANPEKDLNEAETAMVKSYLEAGGDMVVYTEYPTAYPNFMSLLEYYGASAGDVVFETNSQYYYQYTYYLLPELQSHTITDKLIESKLLVLAPVAHAIVESNLHRDTITFEPLLKTTDSAWTGKLLSSGEMPNQSAATASGQFSIGAIITEKYGDITTRIAWYGAASMLDDSTNTLVRGNNSAVFVNTVGYLCDFSSAIGTHSKTMDVNYMVMSTGQSTFMGVVLCAILPLAVLAVGFAVYFRRRTK